MLRLFLVAALFALAASTPAADRPPILQLYNWNNYIADETIARFERECACRVQQDYYTDNEELLAKLEAGATGYDILVPTGNAVETLIRQGALRPLDKSRLANTRAAGGPTSRIASSTSCSTPAMRRSCRT